MRLRFRNSYFHDFRKMLQNRFLLSFNFLFLPIKKDTTQHSLPLFSQTVHITIINSPINLYFILQNSSQLRIVLFLFLHLQILHRFIFIEGEGVIFPIGVLRVHTYFCFKGVADKGASVEFIPSVVFQLQFWLLSELVFTWGKDGIGLKKIPTFSPGLLKLFCFVALFVSLMIIFDLFLHFNQRLHPLKLSIIVIDHEYMLIIIFSYEKSFSRTTMSKTHKISLTYFLHSFKKIQQAMEEDKKSTNQLIRIIFQKCKDAGPELVLLTKKIEEISANGLLKQSRKVRKKDCLNPTFLIKLSECGQNIRLILQHVVSLQFPGRQTMKRYYNQFMQVIYDIRKYHEQAHTNHDMHTNSTQMKSNLLQQLQEEIKKRQSLEIHLQNLREEHSRDIGERQHRIRQLQDTIRDRDDINLSHISKISKKVDREFYGQFYGATGDKFIKVEEDNEGQIDRLKKRIKELEDLLNKKDQVHQEELGYHKQGILELQSKFQELMKNTVNENSQSLKLSTFRRNSPDKISNLPPPPPSPPSPPKNDLQDDFYRLLSIQAITIQQFLGEQND